MFYSTFSSSSPCTPHSMVEIIALQWPFGFSSVAMEKLIEVVCNFFGQFPYLSLHAFDHSFGVFVVGDNHFGDFGQGFFQLCGAVP